MWRYAHLNNVHGPPRTYGDDHAVRLVLVFVAATRFFCHFLDAIASPNTYPCQSVSQSVSNSFILEIAISELCELVFSFFTFYKVFSLQSASPGSSSYWRWKTTGKNFIKGCIFQPTEFNQLDHEKRFKLVLAALLGGTTVYSLTVIGFTHRVSAGTTFNIYNKIITK